MVSLGPGLWLSSVHVDSGPQRSMTVGLFQTTMLPTGSPPDSPDTPVCSTGYVSGHNPPTQSLSKGHLHRKHYSKVLLFLDSYHSRLSSCKGSYPWSVTFRESFSIVESPWLWVPSTLFLSTLRRVLQYPHVTVQCVSEPLVLFLK